MDVLTEKYNGFTSRRFPFFPQFESSLSPVFALILTLKSMEPTGGADKSLARPGRKQATATEDIDVSISYL